MVLVFQVEVLGQATGRAADLLARGAVPAPGHRLTMEMGSTQTRGEATTRTVRVHRMWNGAVGDCRDD